MLERLIQFFQERSPDQLARDALDVFIVYYLIYRALLVVRGTRALQVGVGLVAIFLLYVVAQRLQLVTVMNILGALISSIILVVIVIFQNDIRRGLMRLGRGANFGGGTRTAEAQVIDEVVDAATELARHRMGAIITFEKEANLDEFVDQNHKGIDMDAQVSKELLVSLFVPEAMNKLHDGAVIIRHLRIAKAGVFFPMSHGRKLDAKYGSRHRAALGITEETDTVVVVVSEERGTISYCFGGNIVPAVPVQELRRLLDAALNPKRKRQKAKPRPSGAPASKASSDRKPLREAPATTTAEDDAPKSIRRPSTAEADAPSSRRPRISAESESPPPLRPREEETPSTPPPPPLRKSKPSDDEGTPAPLRRRVSDSDAPPPLRRSTSDSEPPPPLRRSIATEETENEPPVAGPAGPGTPLPVAPQPKLLEAAPADTTPVPLSRRPSALTRDEDEDPQSEPNPGGTH